MNSVAEVADAVAGLPRPILLAFDVDGVLAPLVDHPSKSRLTDGVGGQLDRLARSPDVQVAVVSGRHHADLTGSFGFADPVWVVGSHGGELGRPGVTLPPADEERLRTLAVIASAVAAASPCAWVEHKPASVVLHVRRCPPAVGAAALALFAARVETEDAALVALPGHAVLEASLHRHDKGAALDALRRQLGVRSVFFAGDDVTDEAGFIRLAATDVGVKVGPGPTAARYRLAGPPQIAELIRELAG